jgi:hypothetical protein
METLQDSKLFTLQEVKFKKLETKMLNFFDKARKNLIDETWLLIALMEDECELLLMKLVEQCLLIPWGTHTKSKRLMLQKLILKNVQKTWTVHLQVITITHLKQRKG